MIRGEQKKPEAASKAEMSTEKCLHFTSCCNGCGFPLFMYKSREKKRKTLGNSQAGLNQSDI